MMMDAIPARRGVLSRVSRLFAAFSPEPAPTPEIALLCEPGTASAERLVEAEALLLELLGDEDWTSINELLEEWDSGPTRLPDGRPLYASAMDLMAASLSDGQTPASGCLPFALPTIDNVTLSRFIVLAETADEAPLVRTFCAHLMILDAWRQRGIGAPETVTYNGRAGAIRMAERAARILDEAETLWPGSPLIAHTRLGLLPFLAQGPDDVTAAWAALRDRDPAALDGVDRLAFYLLPRWFGGDAALDDHLREMAAGDVGMAGYALGYLAVIGDEPAAFLTLDADLMERGVFDLLDRRADDPESAAAIFLALRDLGRTTAPNGLNRGARADWQKRAALMQALAGRVMRERIHRIVPSIWGGEAACRNYVAEEFATEIAAGRPVAMTGRGIGIAPDGPPPALA